ncbi:hypothetical protein [Sunxiuqinia indica]|uniref:hypothetical protein n=1 Tax=Sunxiuqinia indica TaxID=2692584 RepID=UPI001357FCD7|nr:hypothetical protein [Sunxiuqinia indica]
MNNDGVSNRQIGGLLSISRNTVNTYIKLAKASDYSIGELLAMTPGQLDELFTAHTTLITNWYDELMAWFDNTRTRTWDPLPIAPYWNLNLKLHNKEIIDFFDNRSRNSYPKSFNAKQKAFRAAFKGVSNVKYFLFRIVKIYD